MARKTKLISLFFITIFIFFIINFNNNISAEQGLISSINNQNLIASNKDSVNITNASNNFVNNSNNSVNTPKTSQGRLAIKLSIDSIDSLKVSQGDTIAQGEVIAIKNDLKDKLSKKLSSLKFDKELLLNSQPTPPSEPLEIPPLSVLPPISYLEYEADIERKKIEIDFIQDSIDLKNTEIEYLLSLEHLDNKIIEHEKSKLSSLDKELTIATKNYQLAVGRLESAKNDRKYREYQSKLNQNKRIESINQQKLNYDRQVADYKRDLSSYSIRVAEIDQNINDVIESINSETKILSSYSGVIRRINVTDQGTNGYLNVEISLIPNK